MSGVDHYTTNEAMTCKKVRYRDEIDAKIALASTQRKQHSRREEGRVYLCPKCRAWHLTSQRGGDR